MTDNQGDRPDQPQPPQASSPPPVPPVGPAAPTWSPIPHGAYGPPAQPGPGAPGQSFGMPAQPDQPTLPTVPFDAAPATGATAVATATRTKSGAGRVAGLLVAAALVGGAAGLGGSYAGTALWSPVGTSTASGPSVVTVNDTDSVNNTTAVAAKVTPSVVTISVSDQASSSGGSGSGVVVSDDGYVLTNTHVVTLDGASADPAISVSTSDGRVYSASIVGTDPTYDLAVIKLEDASGLTAIEWGDSSALNVGDATIAVGAPLGLANTVTTGIVSALNRSIEIASSAAPDSGDTDSGQEAPNGQDSPFQFDFGQGDAGAATETIKIAVLQTDAAINPGNSGGALVDAEGKLIGINVAIASTSSSSDGQSGSIGVGFSIPSAVAERISEELIADGVATHGLLGASVQNAATVEGSAISGAYIAELTAGGAAEAAGLETGDTVTAFNGVPITDSVDLTAQVRAAAAGSTATVTYVRDGETRTLDVTLGALTP